MLFLCLCFMSNALEVIPLVQSETWVISPYSFKDVPEINLGKIKSQISHLPRGEKKHYCFVNYLCCWLKEHFMAEMGHFQ